MDKCNIIIMIRFLFVLLRIFCDLKEVIIVLVNDQVLQVKYIYSCFFDVICLLFIFFNFILLDSNLGKNFFRYMLGIWELFRIVYE